MARGIALAFLDGEWRHDELASRAADALGAGGIWLRAVVNDVMVAFPRPPRDAPDVLTAFIDGHAAFREVLAKGWLEPVVRRWYLTAPEMASTRWPVPPLPTLGDLAAWLALRDGELDWLADRKGLERHVRAERLLRYRYRWVPKRTGGARLLEAPKGRLRFIQRRILDGILAHISPHDAVHGFRSGRSVLTHAALHAGRAVVVKADLRTFFADVRSPRLFGIFRSAGYPEEVARSLVGLVSNRASLRAVGAAPRPTSVPEVDALFHLKRRLCSSHLPQGAPTSPALANLAAFGLDVRLAALAASVGIAYSRYADDLAFSGDAWLGDGATRLLAFVDRMAREEGFALNPKKSRVMRRRARQIVTGLVVNAQPNVPRPAYDALKATLTNCVRHGPASQARATPSFREHLRGRIAWVASLHPTRGQRLLALYDTIDWSA